jgi:hypothetical protein
MIKMLHKVKIFKIFSVHIIKLTKKVYETSLSF